MAACELENRYNGLANSLPMALFELDSRGNIILINREAVGFFGWNTEEIQGKKFAEKVAKKQLYELLEVFKGAVAQGNQKAMIELASAEKGYLPVNLEVRAVKTPEGVAGFQCLGEETKHGVGGVRNASIVRDLVYELTTTLTIGKGAIELALNKREDRILEVARKALVRQNHIIKNLLDAITLDMGSGLYLKKVDLKELLHASIKELTPTRKKVKLDLEDGLPPVRADPEKIKNLLITILDSVLRGGKKGDKVLITAVREGEHLGICVTSDRPLQVDRNPEFEIIKEVIKAHHGTLRLDDIELCLFLPTYKFKS